MNKNSSRYPLDQNEFYKCPILVSEIVFAYLVVLGRFSAEASEYYSQIEAYTSQRSTTSSAPWETYHDDHREMQRLS